MAINPDSKMSRVRRFFMDNPQEELSTIDVSVKFDIALETARDILYTMRREGLLEHANVWRRLGRAGVA